MENKIINKGDVKRRTILVNKKGWGFNNDKKNTNDFFVTLGEIKNNGISALITEEEKNKIQQNEENIRCQK